MVDVTLDFDGVNCYWQQADTSMLCLSIQQLQRVRQDCDHCLQ